MPFQQIFGWSGRWDDLPASHGAAIFFDLLAVGAAVPARAAHARAHARRSRSRTPGCPTRSRCSRWRATPTTRSSPRWCWPRCWPPATRSASPARPRRLRGAGRPHEVRAARARPDARHARPARAAAAPADRARWRCSRRAFWCSGRWRMIPALSARLAAHDLRAHARLPGQPRLAVLGLGPVRLARRRAGGGGVRGRARAGAGAWSPAASDLVGLARGLRGDPARRPARRWNTGSTSTSRGSSRWRSWRCWGASARRRRRLPDAASEPARSTPRAAAAEHLIRTPISHGSSSEVSKRTGICVTSASIACSRLTPITPPRGPVMPTSVM